MAEDAGLPGSAALPPTCSLCEEAVVRWKVVVAAALAVAAYRWRLSFRGRRGCYAEVGNGLGRPAASALSAACLLRVFLSRLHSAPAQPLQPPGCSSLEFGDRSSSVKLGYFRLWR